MWKAIDRFCDPHTTCPTLFIAVSVNTRGCDHFDDCYHDTFNVISNQLENFWNTKYGQNHSKDPLDMLILEAVSSHGGCDGLRGQWKAVKQFLDPDSKKRLVRSIAIRDAKVKDLICINNSATDILKPLPLPMPTINQIDYSIGHYDDAFVRQNANFNVDVQAFLPLQGEVLSNPTVVDIARNLSTHLSQVSPGQVILKWLFQKNVSAAVHSTRKDHLQEDQDVFKLSFELTDAQLQELNDLRFALVDSFALAAA